MPTKDEIAKRLGDAVIKGMHYFDSLFGVNEPGPQAAMIAMSEEIAAILAEQSDEIEQLKARAVFKPTPEERAALVDGVRLTHACPAGARCGCGREG